MSLSFELGRDELEMQLEKMDREVTNIYRNLIQIDVLAKKIGEQVDPEYRWSAINLIRYLTLRTLDLREIQDLLSEYGISSLRSGEGYTLKNVVDVLSLIKMLRKIDWHPDPGLGLIGYEKSIKIMVTMPTEAANDKQLVNDLIVGGMEIARINLCHDNPIIWKNISENVRICSKELAIPCKIAMDLGGPKLRINEILVGHKKKVFSVDRARVFNGDKILITLMVTHGKPKIVKKKCKYKLLAISVNLPSLFADVKVGERIYFDDGRIMGKIAEHSDTMMSVLIESGAKEGTFLKVEKGINLPDTDIKSSSLTEEDILNIPLTLEYADIINYSFVRKPEDVENLFRILGNQIHKKGIILKFKNQEACKNLKRLRIFS